MLITTRAMLRRPVQETLARSVSGPILSLVFIIAIGFGNFAIAQNGPADKSIDPDIVRQKIAALAELDETVSIDEQPESWLQTRRDKILPELIAALDDRNPKIAARVLTMLRGIAPSQQLTDALIAKAGDPQTPLRLEALRQLEKSANDPRVLALLDSASTQAAAFPDPLIRAQWAILAGQRDRAVEILKVLLLRKNAHYDFEAIRAVRLLGETQGPATIALLKTIASDDSWDTAAEAYQVLAKVDPANHALTADQKTFLERWWGGKESGEDFQKRTHGLAKLNVEELRPYVLQMLRDEFRARNCALTILALWKDKKSLPQVRPMMHVERSIWRDKVVAAFLGIDDSQQAQDEVLNLLKDNSTAAPPLYYSPVSSDSEPIMKGIVLAQIPVERKVTILRAAQARLNLPESVPHAVSFQWNQGQDLRELLVALMDKESNVLTLAQYCNIVERDKERRFAPQVRRAMQILMSDADVVEDAERLKGSKPAAAAMILHAVGIYQLKELAPDVVKLMNFDDPTIRQAAQATGAKLQIKGAVDALYDQLDDAEQGGRMSAVESLLGIKPIDETDRQAREEIVLSCLGKPSESMCCEFLSPARDPDRRQHCKPCSMTPTLAVGFMRRGCLRSFPTSRQRRSPFDGLRSRVCFITTCTSRAQGSTSRLRRKSRFISPSGTLILERLPTKTTNPPSKFSANCCNRSS